MTSARETIDQSAASATADGPTPSEKFHLQALSQHGLLVSTCSLNPSGCHDFGSSLKGPYPKLAKTTCEIDYSNPFRPLVKMDNSSFADVEDNSHFKYLVLTGCSIEASIAALIVNTFKNHKFNGLTNIYFVIPPHMSKKLSECYLEMLKEYKLKFLSYRVEINLLLSGMKPSPFTLGLPMPFPEVESKYTIDEKCYGLIYIRKAEFSENYLKAYLQQIYAASGGKPAVVMLIDGRAQGYRTDELADQYAIRFRHYEKLPQADFIEAMKAIAAKGGIVGMNGAQSLLQALYLKAKPFFHHDNDVNKAICEQLVEHLDNNDAALAREILGLSDTFDLINDGSRKKQCNVVYQKLYALVDQGVATFESTYKRCLASQSNEYKMAENRETIQYERTPTSDLRTMGLFSDATFSRRELPNVQDINPLLMLLAMSSAPSMQEQSRLLLLGKFLSLTINSDFATSAYQSGLGTDRINLSSRYRRENEELNLDEESARTTTSSVTTTLNNSSAFYGSSTVAAPVTATVAATEPSASDSKGCCCVLM